MSISFRPDFAAMDKELNLNMAKEAKDRVKRLNFKMIRDSMLDNHEMLKSLLIAYQDVEPNWLNIHNRVEEKKPQKMQTFLSNKKTINDILDETRDDELAELVLCVTVANRIAHSVSDIMKKHMRSYTDDDVDKETEYKFMNGVRRQFNPSKLKRDPKYINRELENTCYFMGTSIDELKKEGFPDLVRAEQTAFYLKEYSLRELLTVLKDRDDINYGLKDSINKNGKNQKAFVMDLPFYSQFSVHVMEPRLVAQASKAYTKIAGSKEYIDGKSEEINDAEINDIRKNIWELLQGKEYEGTLYEKKNVILKTEQSDETNKFLKSLQGLTEEEQIAKLDKEEEKDPRYGHHLKVAGGYETRSDRSEI